MSEIAGRLPNSSPPRPRAVTVVGWVWLIVAVLRCVDALVCVLVWKVGGLDRGFPLFGFRSERLHIQLSGVEFVMRHRVPILIAQAIVAGAVAWTAFELLRLTPWARPALRVVSGIGIFGAAAAGAFV